MTMQEKRIAVRTQLLSVHASITDDEGLGWSSISVKDISSGGLRFISKKELPLNSRLKFEGDVSDYVRSMDITCDVQLVFCEKTEQGYLCGARFLNLSVAHRTGLSIFIELMVTRHPDLMEQKL